MEQVTTTRQEERRRAAQARRQPIMEENMLGLASIRAVKKQNGVKEDITREANREKHRSIIRWVTEVNSCRRKQHLDWNTPIDWKKVTEKSVHKYIPFEQQNINIGEALNYVTENLAKHGRPKNTCKNIDETTPLWYLSRNAIRKALYRASIRRTKILGQISATAVPPGH